MRLRNTSAAIAALGAAAALAIAGCSSGGSSTTGSTQSSAAPAQLTVWRMGSSTPQQVTWMNGIISQFHKHIAQRRHGLGYAQAKQAQVCLRQETDRHQDPKLR